MDATRALLDALMGPNRNEKGAKTSASGQPDWEDKTICKHFLVGFCPHELFGSVAKRNLTPCSKIHSEVMKTQFEEHPDVTKYRVEYEEDFLGVLEKIATECDQYIRRERPKCRPRGGKNVQLPSGVQQKVDELEKRYAELIRSAEKSADEDSSLALSQAQMKQALAVKEELESTKQGYGAEFPGEDVCDICGVRYPCGAGWEGHDFRSHMRGKTHDGYERVRQKIAELRDRKKEWEKLRESEKEWFKARRKAHEKEAEKERAKEKDKERERQRERDRERERERVERERIEREREKDRRNREDKERERAKGKDRERSRHKDRGGRDRERDADRDKASKVKDARDSKDTRDSKGRERDKGKEKRGGGGGGSPSHERSRSPRKAAAVAGAAAEEEDVVLEIQDEDIPRFWATLGTMPADERAEAMSALSTASSERLERWLEARIAARKGQD
mmetsp:Transcript_34195/g.76425  ORF Transcript_34195/g.76425 Transcript_34195/m.76425 type:complete len:449 (-) Transcript_34195:26-1372(-)